MAETLQKTNKFTIVGTLKQADIKTGVSAKTGIAYVSVKTIVNSVINGVNNEFEVDFYSSQLTAQNKESTFYTTYSKLNELEGKKVEIQGSIRENRYFSTKLNQMCSTQELAGRFIKGVSSNTVDTATWEMSGFITTQLTEKTNKKGEIYEYDLKLAQSNYSDTAISVYNFAIDPLKIEIVKGATSYNAGDTVKLNGDLYRVVTQVTSQANNDGGFGEAAVRTFTNVIRKFYIKGGSAPIKDETTYSPLVIQQFVAAYKAHDVELQKNADNKETAVENKTVISQRQNSLI